MEDEPLVLTYVAELLKNKNQTVLLRALKRIRQQRNVGVLLLPGPDHWNGYLEQEAQHLGVAPYVRFLGWRSDVRQILAVTNIYVASSLREGLPLNLIEAQCAGLPIVAWGKIEVTGNWCRMEKTAFWCRPKMMWPLRTRFSNCTTMRLCGNAWLRPGKSR